MALRASTPAMICSVHASQARLNLSSFERPNHSSMAVMLAATWFSLLGCKASCNAQLSAKKNSHCTKLKPVWVSMRFAPSALNGESSGTLTPVPGSGTQLGRELKMRSASSASCSQPCSQYVCRVLAWGLSDARKAKPDWTTALRKVSNESRNDEGRISSVEFVRRSSLAARHFRIGVFFPSGSHW